MESIIFDLDENIQEKFSLLDNVPEKLGKYLINKGNYCFLIIYFCLSDGNIVSLREELNVLKKYKQLKGEIDSLTRIIGFRRLQETENKLILFNEKLMIIQKKKNDVKHELSDFNIKYNSLNNLLKSQENELEFVEQKAVNAV